MVEALFSDEKLNKNCVKKKSLFIIINRLAVFAMASAAAPRQVVGATDLAILG